MTTKREQILARLEVLLATIPGITAAYRNRAEFPDDKLPAAVLLDGSERIIEQVAQYKSVRMPPAIMVLMPQVFVILKPRDDLSNTTLGGISAPIGEELSTYLDRVITAVVNDPTLVSLVGSNGQISYRGSETDMATGSSIVGQLRVDFDFHYVFMPPQG